MADGRTQRFGKTRKALTRITKDMLKHTAQRQKSILKNAALHSSCGSLCAETARRPQQTHTPPAINHQWTRTKRYTPPPPPVQSHGQRHTATARCKHTKQAITKRATRRSDTLSIHDATTTFPAIPPTMGFGARLKAVTCGTSHPQEE
ncbi:hypothetical protein TcCL_NonESM11450 [Trypanosoma cruzi]|nr:hypothetical protein TcCL_NonESM11450 [Trypanosoma cruzi]